MYIPFCSGIICSIFGFHGFSQKIVSRLIQFLSEKVKVDLAEFGTQAAEKLWDLTKKVKIFGLGN
jgi:hypothetical protein